jgi:hypothetical protein
MRSKVVFLRFLLIPVLSLLACSSLSYASDPDPLSKDDAHNRCSQKSQLPFYDDTMLKILSHSSPHGVLAFSETCFNAFRISRNEHLWLSLFLEGHLGTPEEVGEEPFDRTCFQIYVSQCFYRKGMKLLNDGKSNEAYQCFVNGAYGGHLLCPLKVAGLLNSDQLSNWLAPLTPEDPIKYFFDKEYNNLRKPESTNPQIREINSLIKSNYKEKSIKQLWKDLQDQINGLIRDIDESAYPEVHFFKIIHFFLQNEEENPQEKIPLEVREQINKTINGLIEFHKNNKLSDFQAAQLTDFISNKEFYDNPDDALIILKSLEGRKLKSVYKKLCDFYEEREEKPLVLKYHRAAANRGSKDSQCSLGYHLLYQCSQPSVEGLYWLHRSTHSSNGFESLVNIYEHGVSKSTNQGPFEIIIDPRPERIVPWLSQAASRGNQLASYELARRNENYSQAWAILQSLNPRQERVLYTLAKAYEKGLGEVLGVNLDQAADYYYQSAKEGYYVTETNGQNIDLTRLAQLGNQKAQEYLDLLE